MVFELASTNLVIEPGIILAVLLGWQFTASEFTGGIVMVIIIALLFRLTLTPRLVQMAREHAEQGGPGRMEGHATMDISVQGGPFLSRLLSGRAFHAADDEHSRGQNVHGPQCPQWTFDGRHGSSGDGARSRRSNGTWRRILTGSTGTVTFLALSK